jgi:hypothetical protein
MAKFIVSTSFAFDCTTAITAEKLNIWTRPFLYIDTEQQHHTKVFEYQNKYILIWKSGHKPELYDNLHK